MDDHHSGSMAEESLFSLELAVDTLHLQQHIVCRFPAVAFRLLDFPTLMIYHVEEDLAANIHRKIALDAYYKLEKQMTELKNKQGDFAIKKGKSCLFRAAKDTLLEHLESIPMYVMILDNFPKVPKLIGSCMLPLDKLMRLVAKDIDKSGLSVPTTHGECGSFELFNLMGVSIGTVSFGYRLLSLGTGLLAHIPNSAVYRLARSKPPLQRPKQEHDIIPPALVQETTDLILEDIENADKPSSVGTMFGAPHVEREHNTTQTNMASYKVEQTQTEATRSGMSSGGKVGKPVKNSYPRSPAAYNDVFVTNAICPPPLFYNRDLEPKEGLTFYDGEIVVPVQNPSHLVHGVDVDEDYADDSTIRDEDKVSDDDIYVDFVSSEIVRKKRAEKLKADDLFHKHHVPDVLQPAMASPGGADITQLPLLNALIQEILKLQTGSAHVATPPADSEPVVTSPKQPDAPPEKPKPDKRQHPTKESREEFLKRMATSKGAAPGAVSSHHKRTEKLEESREPRKQSYTAEQQGVRKSKLQSGMTNTQRLRLALTNPEVLPELEQQETERLHRRNSARSGLYSERSAYQYSSHPDVPPLQLGRRDSGVQQTARTEYETSRSEMHKRKPIPTPRVSKVRSSDIKAVLSRQQEMFMNDAEEVVPSPIPYEYNIIPSHRTDGDNYSMSFESSEEYSPRNVGRTQVINSPKYPPPISPRKMTSRSQGSMSYDQYSADFDDSKVLSSGMEGLEPELRQYRECFSDSDEMSGEEPRLRKVVDMYSDGSADDEDMPSARSYRTRSSNVSSVKEAAPMPKVTSSILSPKPASKRQVSGSRDVVESSTALTAVHASNPPLTESNESTAYIPQSAIPSQSFDSYGGEPRSPAHRPKPSPRRYSRPRLDSQNTESVSSYVPSDADLSRIDSGDGYSDDFDLEDVSEYQGIKTMSKLKVSDRAKLGYTWT